MLERYDLRSRQNQDIGPWPESNWGWGDRDMKYRFQWTYPVLRSPNDPKILYVTSQFVHKSTDEGRTWEIISPDLTRHDPTKLEPMTSYGNETPGEYWGPITRDDTGIEWYSTVFAFAESPVKRDLLWAGSDDGYVQLSQDGGKNWTNVTPKDLPEFALISIIEPSPHDPATAYLAATRYKLQDQHPYLYKTHDYGKTWSRDHDRHSQRRFHARDTARTRDSADCCLPAPKRESTYHSTMERTGSPCGSICRPCRCMT